MKCVECGRDEFTNPTAIGPMCNICHGRYMIRTSDCRKGCHLIEVKDSIIRQDSFCQICKTYVVVNKIVSREIFNAA